MRLNALLPLTLALLAAPLLHAEELPQAIKQLQAKGAVSRVASTRPTACAAMPLNTRTTALPCT